MKKRAALSFARLGLWTWHNSSRCMDSSDTVFSPGVIIAFLQPLKTSSTLNISSLISTASGNRIQILLSCSCRCDPWLLLLLATSQHITSKICVCTTRTSWNSKLNNVRHLLTGTTMGCSLNAAVIEREGKSTVGTGMPISFFFLFFILLWDT